MFGEKVRNALLHIDARLSLLEAAQQLPEPVTGFANGPNTFLGAVGVWGVLPTNTFNVQITNPSDTFDLVCFVFFGAWLVAAGGDVRMGVDVTGGVVSDPDPGANSPAAFGLMPDEGANNLTSSHMGVFRLNIPAGASTVTLTPKAFRSAASSTNVNYPVIEVVPFRYQLP
jgi:hypothetical protein